MRRGVALIAYLTSAALHVALFRALLAIPSRAHDVEPVEVEIAETRRPPPPPERVETRRARRRLAFAPQAPRPPQAPPPPNAPSPADASPPEKAPVRIGISMSSTAEAGVAAAPVGNSLYGEAPRRAPDPEGAAPYRADRYAPPTELTSLPEPISTEVPASEYPEEARRIGFEGSVRVRLLVDEQGLVREVKVLEDPGHGLGRAAARVARRFYRFRPARRGSEAVATEIPFTIRFELP